MRRDQDGQLGSVVLAFLVVAEGRDEKLPEAKIFKTIDNDIANGVFGVTLAVCIFTR